RWRDRHHSVPGKWPDEQASLQPLREQAHALAIVPQHLDQAAAPAAEHEQMAAVGIALERLLHQHRQPIEALAHVGVTGRQPHLYPARHRDHRDLAFASTVTSALTVEASTDPIRRIRAPVANSISIAGGAPGTGATTTGENAGAADAAPHNCCRHRNNWLT